MEKLVILGKVQLDIITPKKDNRIYCDDCHSEVNCSFGDPREKVTTEYADGTKEERWICPSCVWFQWGQFEPSNIFDGRNDY